MSMLVFSDGWDDDRIGRRWRAMGGAMVGRWVSIVSAVAIAIIAIAIAIAITIAIALEGAAMAPVVLRCPAAIGTPL